MESTGLPFSRPRVTEVALVALSFHNFAELSAKWAPAQPTPAPLRQPHLPDGISTLSFLVNPKKSTTAAWLNGSFRLPSSALPSYPFSSLSTGLTDELLQKEKPFGKATLHRILDFLAPLPKPALILAHNGRCFDFPLLLKEIKLCSGRKLWEAAQENLLWLDTMAALRNVERCWLDELKRAATDWHYQRQATPITTQPLRQSNLEQTAENREAEDGGRGGERRSEALLSDHAESEGGGRGGEERDGRGDEGG